MNEKEREGLFHQTNFVCKRCSPLESENIGKRMIWGMQANGDGSYSGGKIWAPDRDKVYSSKMSLSGNALEVSGCVLVVCRAQSWTRVQ